MALAAGSGSSDEKAPAMVTLISSDSERFEVAEAAATLSQTIRHMIEDGCTDGGVPLPNVTGKILAKVLEYCNKHAPTAGDAEGSSSSSDAAAVPSQEELKAFDDELVDNVDQATLFELILAANYLDVKGLLDIACQKVADSIKDKSPEEIREVFNIQNDFTPEEEEEVRRENAWAFD